MCLCGRIALCGLAVGLATALSVFAADDPASLLKPVVPTGTQARVRVAVEGGAPRTMQFKAQVPHGKTKAEMVSVSVAIDTQGGKSYVAAKTVEAWGYEVPKNKEFVLPELLVPAAQIAPAKKGRDVLVRITNVKLYVTEPPAEAKNNIFNCNMSLCAADLYKGAEKTMEPRLAFADHFLELTVPATGLKRLDTDDTPLPNVTADATPTLVPSAAPTIRRQGNPVFAYVTVNGQESYKLGNGTAVPLHVSVGSINNWDTGVILSIGLARGCKVEMDERGTAGMATGAESSSIMIPGKIKELRLGLSTGSDLRVQKDLVLKDIAVVVDRNVSEGFVSLGPKFIETYFKNGVYACGTDGVWKLNGRCDPELLFDIKTRPKKP